jgi:hypothetical protein
MFVPTEADASRQLRRLETLGYTIIDISPPLAGHVMQLSETQPQTNHVPKGSKEAEGRHAR